MIGTNSVDALQQTGNSFSQTPDVSALRSQGEINGLSVVIDDDPVAAVQDAAEEATFGVDNSKKQKLADRKQKQNANSLIIERAAEYAAIIVKFHNADYDAKKRIYEKTKNSRISDVRKFLGDLKSLGGKPSSDYAFLIQTAKEEADPHLKQFLKDAADSLFRENSKEILATLNSVEVAAESSLSDSVTLCESYGELASDPAEPEKMMDFIQKKFGEDRVDEGVEFMLKSLAADLASPMSSSEPAVLELVGRNLSVVRSLNSGKAILASFVTRLGAAHDIKADISSARILSGIIELSKQRFITPSSIRELYREVAKQQPDTEVLLAQDLLTSCRRLGSELFDKEESRVRVIQAVEELVDNLVDAEDKWLEEGAN
ncbi:MAG: TyeA family type III secretion system gatekeeper subunit [Succinivibrionaceae bacterium]|nr:TyeA family type III secretion system gatekeeper subunit [Succinivibrionaceae bacterium]